MAKKPAKKDDKGVGTTGHSWDGIEEYNNPMPRWWLWTFYATIVWAVIWTVLMPAWPMVREATPGLLGYSSREEVAKEIARVSAMNAPLDNRIVNASLQEIVDDPELNRYAISGGSAVFQIWCSQCHGAGAAGAKGYPNLRDDDWIWGGELAEIHQTIAHGIRADEDPDTHYSLMTAFDEILSDEEISAVVAHVRRISGQSTSGDVELGAQVYADNCVSCHGENGRGMRELGAPNLTDAIWLYGGDEATLEQTVRYARFGVMPSWATRLSEAELRQVAVYVHSLGGGEAADTLAPEEQDAPAEPAAQTDDGDDMGENAAPASH